MPYQSGAEPREGIETMNQGLKARSIPVFEHTRRRSLEFQSLDGLLRSNQHGQHGVGQSEFYGFQSDPLKVSAR
jgi:hypothetical protein